MSVQPNSFSVAPLGASQGAASLPTADAGADQTQSDLSVVTLDGSGSTGATSYAWVLQEVAADGTISTQTGLLSDATAESPTFTPRELGASYTAILTATNGDGSAVDAAVVSITQDVVVLLTDMTERDGPSAFTSVDSDTIVMNSTSSTVNSAGASDGARLTITIPHDPDGYKGIEIRLGVTSYPTSGSGLRGLSVQVQDGTVQGTAAGARAVWTYATAPAEHRLDVDDDLWTAFSSSGNTTTTAVEMIATFMWGTADGGSETIFTGTALLYDAAGEIIHDVGGVLTDTGWSPGSTITLELGCQNGSGAGVTFDGVTLQYRLIPA